MTGIVAKWQCLFLPLYIYIHIYMYMNEWMTGTCEQVRDVSTKTTLDFILHTSCNKRWWIQWKAVCYIKSQHDKTESMRRNIDSDIIHHLSFSKCSVSYWSQSVIIMHSYHFCHFVYCPLKPLPNTNNEHVDDVSWQLSNRINFITNFVSLHNAFIDKHELRHKYNTKEIPI